MEMEFFFDYLSPHAYLCWPQLKELSLRYCTKLIAHPISSTMLSEHWEDLCFFHIPQEKEFVYKDCLRAATLLGMPFIPPRIHPFNSFLLLRASLAEFAQKDQEKMIDLLWRQLWGKGLNVRSAEELVSLAQSEGIDGHKILSASEGNLGKRLLQTRTDEAIERGIFRVPTVMIGQELFYGHEQIPLIELYLRGEDPLLGARLLLGLHASPR